MTDTHLARMTMKAWQGDGPNEAEVTYKTAWQRLREQQAQRDMDALRKAAKAMDEAYSAVAAVQQARRDIMATIGADK